MTHSDALAPFCRIADPLADQTVARIVGPWASSAHPGAPAMARLAQATRLMAGWPANGELRRWNPSASGIDPDVVAALQDYLQAGGNLPSWADAAQVERAEAVFMAEGPLSCTLLFCASLPSCYVPPHLARVLHIAGQLEAHTEHRIRQTAAMVFPVMLRGGLCLPTGQGITQVLKVRLIHATIRHLIVHGNPESASTTPPRYAARAPDRGCSTDLHSALLDHGWDSGTDPLPCNQVELAYTLLTFSYVFLRGMRELGLPLRTADETAFLHAWNVAGHVLGVDARLMAHDYNAAETLFTRLGAMQNVSPPAPDPRPALGQALVGTMARSIRLPVVRHFPVPLTQRLIGPERAQAIGLGAPAPWVARIAFRLSFGLAAAVDGVARLVFDQFSLSRMLVRVLGYHLVSRFLLDQTRPLNLPQQVLNPMRNTIAHWHHEPRAPSWLNALEDRWTTAGAWVPANDASPTRGGER